MEPTRPPREDPLDRPAPARDGSFTVEVSCESDPERTTVTNTGETEITITRINTLFEDVQGEPFGEAHFQQHELDVVLAAGESRTFLSSRDATGPDVLYENFIYLDGEATEGVEVTTTAGTERVLCTEGTSRSTRTTRATDRRKWRRRTD